MTLDQIFKLLDAGYTKEEINEFNVLQTSEEPEPAKEPKQDDKTDPEPEPAKEPKQDDKTDPEPTPEYINSLMKSIDKLTKTIQISNRNGAEGAAGTEKSAEEVIKDVIGTMTGKKGEK